MKILHLLLFFSTFSYLSNFFESKGFKSNFISSTTDTAIFADSNRNRVDDSAHLQSKVLNLKTAKKIEVISINKENEDDSTDDRYYKCKVWSLTKKQIEFIIRKFDPMTSEEQYLSYSFYKCEISGELTIDLTKYKYWIGAGGTLTLMKNDTKFYFGFTSGTAYKKYFISGKLTEKELNQ